MAFLTFEHVEKHFWRHNLLIHKAIEDFCLDIAEGEFFCLLGPSGCGKTTVLNLLAGFDRPSSGTIKLNRVEVAGPGRDRAVVFQGEDSLYGWLTARENVEFGPRMGGMRPAERHEVAARYLELVGLKRQHGKRPHELSGGMKQRVQIARVLANEPKMLLMDEPFAALDAQNRMVLQSELLRIWRTTQKTVLFITHDIDEAILLGSRIGVMQAGPASRLKTIIEIDPVVKEGGRSHAKFGEYYALLRALIEEEVTKTLHREAADEEEEHAGHG